MEIIKCFELSSEEIAKAEELIEACNICDSTNYDPFPEGDVFYLSFDSKKSNKGIAVLFFGYRIGEMFEGREMMEFYAFTHPLMRGRGLFKACYQKLKEDFKDRYFIRFVVKSPLKMVESGGIISSASAAIYSLSFKSCNPFPVRVIHQRDELFMRKCLKSGIDNPGDVVFPYGEVHFRHYNDNSLYLYGLIVYDSFRGNGYGKKILRDIEEKSSMGKYNSIILEVSSDNFMAYSLYEKLGYKVIDRVAYYVACKIERMEKN